MNRIDVVGRIEWRALANEAKWGKQDPATLIIAMTEELGEIAQAHLQAQHEGGDKERIVDEALDLAPLCLQLIESLRLEEQP